LTKLLSNGYSLINSDYRSTTHPDTWEHPPKEVLDRIRPGYFIKVGVTHAELTGERFWGVVKEMTGNAIELQIDQDLLYTEQHGLSDKDLLLVQPHNVFGILDAGGVSLWPINESSIQ
jgi:hypothetical protein